MATKPLSAADVEKLKGFLKSSSVTPYSPEFISQLSSALKDPPKSKGLAAKPLLKTPTPKSTGLLQSPDTEFTTDNVNPFTNTFTQDAMGPTVQETISAAKPGVPALPSAVPTVERDPNIAVSQTAPQPKMTKEVTTTKKANGDTVEKAKHVEEPVSKPAPKANPGNGELLLGDNVRAGAAPVDDGKPKFNHDIPSMGNINGARMGPAEAPKEGMPIPDDNPYALPEKYRFDPTAPPVPIVAQYPAQMPAIPEGRLTNTEGLTPAENTATQGLTTNISALAPLPKEEEERYAALREQRLGQISDNEAAARDFTTSYSPRTDMSALLSFIGSQLGRDYLKGYQKPAGLGDLVGMQDKLEENIAKAKTGLSDTDMQYLKARMGLQDSQKTSEELKSLMKNLKFAELKGSGSSLADQKYDTTLKQNEYAARKDFMKDTYPGLEGHGKIFDASANLNRLIFKNEGKTPAPYTTEAREMAQAMSELIYLVNQYDAQLGALAAKDVSYLEGALGFAKRGDDEGMKEFLLSNFNDGFVNTAKTFQDKMKKSNRQRIGYARKLYAGYPSVLEMVEEVDSSSKSGIENMELSRLGQAKGQKKIEKKLEDFSPEKQKKLKERAEQLKKASGGK